MPDEPHTGLALYRVEVSFTYYALAKSTREAQNLARDAADDADLTYQADAAPFHAKTDCPASEGWTGDALVYGIEQDATLDSALAAQGLPSVAVLLEQRRARLMKVAESIFACYNSWNPMP